ncbi:S8 family serine peptidase [Microbacterium sp. cf046]|uniref:S8 family serine peptidase n=1 Tax=Microbacterium sp. cf046 TaxID=1761803 RepID=UPI0015871087|nr:S8 family serine peptidase [Microbacterium sp. cf046]
MTIVALACGAASLTGGAAFGAAPADEVIAPVPIESPTGSYIVVLDEAPAATYQGGEARLVATQPEEGEELDPHSSRVQRYVAFLQTRQERVAAAADVEPAATYQIVLNGFSATLTPEDAARVAATEGVRAVYPDEIFHPDSVDSTAAVGAGVTAKVSPAPIAADAPGVVIGVIDTGISPENPSFAGERLRARVGPEPHLDGNEVVFEKADGHEFRSERVTGDGWAKSDYSTKLVGAQVFAAGATAAGFDFTHDVLSPVDSDGHGSRTASIAAGNGDVSAMIDNVPFGVVSGVAPDARIAAYKACFAGEDPLVSTDDICVGSDLIAALERAVADGVDVVDYAIGGGAGASVWAPDDLAFYNAAVAGVFIAVSAGNGGPAAGTAQAGAPWYTTVAASTVRTFEGSLRLSTGFEAGGVSVSVPVGAPVTAPVVYAGDAGLAGSADAALCYAGTLDPAQVEGRIVVCDRGTNSRLEKSEEVADAGGVGMILVNVTPDSLDSDFHSVPTVHIDSSYRDALLSELASSPDVTATLSGENLTGVEIPVPQIAAFSGRGPLAGTDDVLSPDVAAPGVAILAATGNTPEGDPAWDLASGTSMAAAHVAGLAALSLMAHPDATPSEIKSALMTGAANTLNPDGSANVDPFAQGAGQVDPDALLDPALVYPSGPLDWAGFVQARDHGAYEFPFVDGTDLNLPSITIGALAGERTVSRQVTATRAGVYQVAADIPGVDVSVSPETLTFSGPGDTQAFTVTFANDTAPVEVWASGFLSWTGEDGASVRSPLAVRPVTATATDLVVGTGVAGSADLAVVAGASGDIPLQVAGLAPFELLVDPDQPAPGHSGDASSGDANGNIAWVVDIPTGAPLAQFTLEASDESDLDLSVYRVASPSDFRYYERWMPTATSLEQIALVDPTPGSYLVVANVSGAADDATWDLHSAVVDAGADSLTADSESLNAQSGEDARFTLEWSGLRHDTRYLGIVSYGDSAPPTTLVIDSGPEPPVPDEPATVSGTAEIGSVLTVEPGSWDLDDLSFAYRWLRDGEPIADALDPEYRITRADVGTTLTAEVIATQPENVNTGRSISDGVIVRAPSTVAVTLNHYTGSTSQEYAVTVEVDSSRGGMPDGSVSVFVDGDEYTGTLAAGRVTFTLPAQEPGIHVVVAEYAGSDRIQPATGVSGFVVTG